MVNRIKKTTVIVLAMLMVVMNIGMIPVYGESATFDPGSVTAEWIDTSTIAVHFNQDIQLTDDTEKLTFYSDWGSLTPLAENDEVSVSGSDLLIHVANGYNSSFSGIQVQKGAVKNAEGAVLGSDKTMYSIGTKRTVTSVTAQSTEVLSEGESVALHVTGSMLGYSSYNNETTIIAKDEEGNTVGNGKKISNFEDTEADIKYNVPENKTGNARTLSFWYKLGMYGTETKVPDSVRLTQAASENGNPQITSVTYDNTSLENAGGSITATVHGKFLTEESIDAEIHKKDKYSYNSNDFSQASGINITKTLISKEEVQVSFILPKNNEEEDQVYMFRLKKGYNEYYDSAAVPGVDTTFVVPISEEVKNAPKITKVEYSGLDATYSIPNQGGKITATITGNNLTKYPNLHGKIVKYDPATYTNKDTGYNVTIESSSDDNVVMRAEVPANTSEEAESLTFQLYSDTDKPLYVTGAYQNFSVKGVPGKAKFQIPDDKWSAVSDGHGLIIVTFDDSVKVQLNDDIKVSEYFYTCAGGDDDKEIPLTDEDEVTITGNQMMVKLKNPDGRYGFFCMKPKALINGDGAYLDRNSYGKDHRIYMKSGGSVFSVEYNKTAFTSEGGELIAKYKGYGLTTENLKFEVYENDEKSDRKPQVTLLKNDPVDGQEVELRLQLPANESDLTTTWNILTKVNGVTTPSAYIKGSDLIAVLPAGKTETDITMSPSLYISGVNDKDERPEVFETTMDPSGYTAKINVYIRGTNLSSRKTLVKAIDEEGVEWPTHPVYECGASVRWQDSAPYLAELPSKNEQNIELLIPRNLGKNHTFKLYFAPDGKNYLDKPVGTVIVHNDGHIDRTDGFTFEEITELRDIQVRYVDEEGNELLPTEHHKGYGVSELYTYNIKPKEIEGYTLKSSKPFSLTKMEKLLAEPETNAEGMYFNSSHFVRELNNEPITYVYKKVEAQKPDTNPITPRVPVIIPDGDDDVAPTKGETLLHARISNKSATSMKLSWSKIDGADGYNVYFAKKGRTLKRVKSQTATSLTRFRLKKGLIYKFRVKAYKLENGKKVTLYTSPLCYSVAGSSKYTTAKSLKVTPKTLTLQSGDTAKLKASTLKSTRTRSLLPSSLVAAYRYKSTNTAVASVSKSGIVTGILKGTCKVYVYAQNGTRVAVTVTVN